MMTKTITSLEIQKRNKERVNVFLDGEFGFALNLFAAAGLKKGQELSGAEIEQLQQDDERQVAYQRALGFLSHRPRSRAEIERYLREKGYEAPLIEQTVQRLQETKVLDDEEFARFWRESREQFRPRSSRALRYELRQKGIDKAVIDEAVAAVDDDAAAWAAVEPKLARWQELEQVEFAKKVMGFLARRGFAHDVARRAYNHAWAAVGGSGSVDALEEP
jgi:regulatory protein